MKADNEMGVPAQDPRKRPKVRCDSEPIAQKVSRNISWSFYRIPLHAGLVPVRAGK